MMLKQIFDAGKSIALMYRRLVQCEEEIKRLQEADRDKEARLQRSAEVNQRLAYELNTDRQLIAHAREVAERDREDLLLRLENTLLKNEPRLLPGVSAPLYKLSELEAGNRGAAKRPRRINKARRGAGAPSKPRAVTPRRLARFPNGIKFRKRTMFPSSLRRRYF